MYSFNSKIRYSECDSDGRLTLPSLLNYFQDCSTFQSEELGVGVGYLKAHHQVWVLSAWQIEVERYPRLCEEVEIGTFPHEFKAFLGSRNFFMRTKDGRTHNGEEASSGYESPCEQWAVHQYCHGISAGRFWQKTRSTAA